MLRRSLIAVVAASVIAVVASPCCAVLITEWTFETSVPASAGPHAAEFGTGQALGATGGVYSNPAGFGSIESFSSTAWNVGDYYQFSTSTVGFEDITLSFAAMGSNTGPRDFSLAYSTDGTSFTTFGSYTLTNDAWNTTITPAASLKSFDLSSIATIDNAATVFFRVVNSSTISIAGGATASGGTSRIDNFAISGTAIAAIPEPTAALFGSLLAGAFGLMVARRPAGRE